MIPFRSPSLLANQKVPYGTAFNSKKKEEGRKLSLVKISFAALIISSLALPSGSFFGIPVKYITYFACLFALFSQWQKGGKISGGILSLFLSTSIFIFFFLLVGSLRAVANFGHALNEGSTFFTTITIVLLIMAVRSMKLVADEEIVSYAFYGIFLFALWKVIAVLLVTTGILPYETLYTFLMKYMGYRPVYGIIYGGLIRFNLIIYDFIAAAFLFLIPTFPKAFSRIPVFFRAAFMIIGVACLIFAFSRLLFVLVAIFWAYAFIFKFSFKHRLLAIFIAIATIASALPWIEGAYKERFEDPQSRYSDSLRVVQTDALMDAWKHIPLIGGGLGYYAKAYIRDPNMPYNYEVQWIGFFTKFGMIGISFLVFLVILLFHGVLSGKRTSDHYILAFILLSFILGGFTNQYLLNSGSGVFYSLHLLIASILRNNITPPKNDKEHRLTRYNPSRRIA